MSDISNLRDQYKDILTDKEIEFIIERERIPRWEIQTYFSEIYAGPRIRMTHSFINFEDNKEMLMCEFSPKKYPVDDILLMEIEKALRMIEGKKGMKEVEYKQSI